LGACACQSARVDDVCTTSQLVAVFLMCTRSSCIFGWCSGGVGVDQNI
jgi:hypothetical protein